MSGERRACANEFIVVAIAAEKAATLRDEMRGRLEEETEREGESVERREAGRERRKRKEMLDSVIADASNNSLSGD